MTCKRFGLSLVIALVVSVSTTLAQPLDLAQPGSALWQALDFLGQQPPQALAEENLADLWTWAAAHWRIDRIPKWRAIVARDASLIPAATKPS